MVCIQTYAVIRKILLMKGPLCHHRTLSSLTARGEALARQDPRLPPPDPATTRRSTLAARTLRGLRGLRAMEDGPGVAGGCMGARLEGSGAPDYRRERAVAARLRDGKSSAAETPYSGSGSKLHGYM